jgi:predicted acylesterase/phospholipase RssA
MVTGLSGGSINALGVAGFPKGTEKEMVEWLTDHWRSLHTKDVFHLWDKWDPIIHGIFKESGVFDDHPLSVLMNEILKDIGDKYGNSFKRMITIEAMDAISGSLIPFTEKTIDYLDFAKVVLSSASLPGVFPATKWGDWLFIDGGLVWGANVVSAVKRCREIVDSDDKISVDMLITHAGSMNTLEKSSSDAIANVMRLR